MTEAYTRRSVEEWIGATPDSAIPERVKLRIWEREGGRCYLTKKKILPGDAYEFEHVIALSCGGENRESNIRLALKDKHREKTAADRNTSAKLDRIAKKHRGIWPASKSRLQSRPFPGGRNRENTSRNKREGL